MQGNVADNLLLIYRNPAVKRLLRYHECQEVVVGHVHGVPVELVHPSGQQVQRRVVIGLSLSDPHTVQPPTYRS